ncbi:MAG: phosphoribosylanthranilate isomerase [Pseudomonadales bacterium]
MRQSFEHGFIQICGIIDRAEAEMLARCGVRYLGFPLRLPVHKEDCSEAEAAAIIRALEPPVSGVLITYLHRAEEIVALCRKLAAPMVQLHGDVAIEELQRLRLLAADLTVIKSLVVGLHGPDALEAALATAAPWVDAFITDTFDPLTGATGATGRTHDWAVSRRLVAASPRPVILAGGLTPDNVAAAIDRVRPAGVDAHTAVEGADGRKDGDKVARFVAAARAAFDRLP